MANTSESMYTRALHLKTWANEHASRTQLPLFVRRLIRGVVPRGAIVNFPAMEQVQRPGFDGIVEVASPHQFVPAGQSIWEMGVDRDQKGKAERDFQKRTDETSREVQLSTTFIFVTPREWQKKDDWAEEKRVSSNNDWADVKVFDCNDLEHWIDLCPAVDVWFSMETGRRPAGVLDLSYHWEGLCRISEPTLNQEVFLSSRGTAADELLRWFAQEPNSLLLSSSSADESIDFLAALVSSKRENAELERLFVIDSLEAWRQLSLNREPLILVAKCSLVLDSSDVSQAVRNGHHVLIVGKKSAGQFGRELKLPRQEAHLLANMLRECGFDDAHARRYARGCCGSSTILKRLVTQHADSNFPEWSQAEYRTALAPLALIGGWVHREPREQQPTDPFPSNAPIDLGCLNDFMNISRDDLEKAASRWSDCDQPLFIRFGDNVLLSSREDSWYLLGAAITPQILEKFEDLAILVLEENDPALELDANNRWFANIYGKVHSLSSEMRRGIVETLALMAVYPTCGEPALATDFRGCVRRVLERVLPSHASWQRWATFGEQLKLIAEADPDLLLSRIEDDLASNDAQISRLCSESDGGFLGGGFYHSGLLWALEVMAWSHDYLPRVAKVLGRLIEIEQHLASNLGDRPSETFRNIFLWWLPHTNATISQRISALDQLVAELPESGWRALVLLLPTIHGFTMTTAQPRWQAWALGWNRDSASQEAYLYSNALAECILNHAGHDPCKWSQILDGMISSPGVVTQSITRLRDIAAGSPAEAGQAALWTALNDFIVRHEAHAEAEWSASAATLQELAEIREQLTPSDPVVLNQWLFSNHPELPYIDTSEGWDEYYAELARRRSAAMCDILNQLGYVGVERLLQAGADGYSVGWVLGRERLLCAEEISLPELIDGEDIERLHLAESFIGGSFETFGFGAMQPLLDTLSVDQCGFALAAVRQDQTTWNWIDQHCTHDVQSAFWGRVNRVWNCENEHELNYVVERLLGVRRAYTAINTVYMSSLSNVPLEVNLVQLTLTAGLSTETNAEALLQGHQFPIQHLIEFLQTQSEDLEEVLLQIEWGYLGLLDGHYSRVGPATLYRTIQNNPDWFVALLETVYRADGDDSERRELSPLESQRCQQAHALLTSFSNLPGADDDGVIDANFLSDWVDRVRKLAEERDRLGVADSHLGQLLAEGGGPIPIFSEGENQPSLFDWPPSEVCEVVERIGSDSLVRGFSIGIQNSGGVTRRDPFEGGTLERERANRCRALAEHHNGTFPRVAAVLRDIAECYEARAVEVDQEAERLRLER